MTHERNVSSSDFTKVALGSSIEYNGQNYTAICVDGCGRLLDSKSVVTPDTFAVDGKNIYIPNTMIRYGDWITYNCLSSSGAVRGFRAQLVQISSGVGKLISEDGNRCFEMGVHLNIHGKVSKRGLERSYNIEIISHD